MINDHIHFGGGGDAVFRLEREAYEEAGHEVFTFSQAERVPENASRRDVVCVTGEGRLRAKLGKFGLAPSVSRSLRRLLERVRPDLVRVHLVSKYPAAIYPELKGHRVIQTLHGPNLFCATSWGNLRSGGSCELGVGRKCWIRGCVGLHEMALHTMLDRRVQPAVKAAVQLYHCPSRQIQEKAEALGYHPTIHIPYGIDHSFIDARPAAHEGPPTILYVGALVEQKGLMFLPAAMKQIVQEVPEARLILCGRGPLENRVKEEFESSGVAESVEFRGFVDHSNMVDLYRNAHVLVLPSIWAEQFGLVGPEALACGVPCVASDVGGIPEWLKDGERGFLVPPRESRALADRVVQLLVSRSLRLRFGDAGRDYARSVHDPEAYQKRWLELAASFGCAANFPAVPHS